MVALGDSYSAGTGAPPYDPGSNGCQRSALSWPRLLAADTARITSIDHRACGGATVRELLRPWAQRKQRAQIPAEPETDVRLVTLTIGGNDVESGALVLRCVLATCLPVDDPGLQRALADLTRSLEEDVYPELEHAYPNARIAHVSYSHIVPPTGDVVGCPWLQPGEQQVATDLVDAINGAIRTAADRAGVTFVDVADALAGHELCSSDPWLVPIGAADQAHPTVHGQTAIEHAVADALDLPPRSR
jgi:lysophospholipase L1-like esterase